MARLRDLVRARRAKGDQAGWTSHKMDWTPVDTDWCTGDWVALDEDTCFYVPGSVSQRATVLYFLHAMLPPTASPGTLQAIAASAAEERGVVALFPRGKQGLCNWESAVKDWWCWPSNREAVDEQAPGITEKWHKAEALLEQVLGVTVEKRYLLGFSNGGYFASYIGLERLYPLDGVGVVAAGRSRVDRGLLAEEHPPFYIAVGAHDQTSVKAGAQNLASLLTEEGWPNAFVEHRDRGHEIHPDDMDSAWRVWGGM